MKVYSWFLRISNAKISTIYGELVCVKIVAASKRKMTGKLCSSVTIV